MKKAGLVVASPYNNGAIFRRGENVLNRDNCLQFYFDLQDIFLAYGISLNTHDINLPDQCDYVLYIEVPPYPPAKSQINKSSLLLFECEVIKPDNWKTSSHQNFSNIFTWHDRLIDGRHYFKMHYTHDTRVLNFLPFKEKTGFCTLIAGNKSTTHPLELYSHRLKAIRWFEKTHPEQFEFYGAGWDMFTFNESNLARIFNRCSFLRNVRKVAARKYPSYRGKVKHKLETLQAYKFSICYENAQQVPGYITEKIFDSMAAGCVPVYWGAPNISDYVPDTCFVDKRKFATYEALYDYLIKMTESEYNRRLDAMASYLQSTQHEKFTPHYNAKLIVDSILGNRF